MLECDKDELERKATQALECICTQLGVLNATMAAWLAWLESANVPVGITVNPGKPIERANMGSLFTAKWVKKSACTRRAIVHKPGMAAATSFQFTDNEDGTCTVNGVNAAGDILDLSQTFTLLPVPVSDTPAVVSVDAPVGMTFGYHGLSAGTANINVQATQNAGVTPAAGPFAFTEPMTCVADSTPSGITVNPGTPTPRPPVVPPSP